jgi:hypothetical protein
MLESLQTYRKRVSGKTLTVEQFNATTIMDAWDIERIGNVVRLSVYAGYLSEDEAYQWLAVADQMAKQRFTAWSQYAASFLLGRALSYPDNIEGVERFADNTGSALNRADSPWRKYPL